MKKNVVQAIVTSATLLGMLAGCTEAITPKKVSANKSYQTGVASAAEVSQRFNPKVDILFVIDDSGSMSDEQRKLRDAVPGFVRNLGNYLDWQIGVTRSWDDSNNIVGREHKFWPAIVRDVTGDRPMVRGELIPVMHPTDPNGVLSNSIGGRRMALRYINKHTDVLGFDAPQGVPEYNVLLNQHLIVGVRGFANTGDARTGQGAQYEVLMDVAKDALTPGSRAAFYNQGFLRPGSRLVIVFVTDAPDASIPEATYYAQYFRDLAESNLGANTSAQDREHALTTFAIIPHTTTCEPDPDLRGLRLPRDLRVHQLVELVMGRENINQFSFDICSAGYGRQMANLGTVIRENTPIRIPLNSGRPDNRLEVWYGRRDPANRANIIGRKLVTGTDWTVDPQQGYAIIIEQGIFERYDLDEAGDFIVNNYYPQQSL